MTVARSALLAISLLVGTTALASECLRQTVPEAQGLVVSGNEGKLREAIAAIEPKTHGQDGADTAPWLTAQGSMLLDLGEHSAAQSLLRKAIRGWLLAGRVDAEVCARQLLAFSLTMDFQPRAALAETLLAEARAEDAGLDWQLNRLRQSRIMLLLTLNERLEEALLLMQAVHPGDSAAEAISWYQSRGLVLGRLRRHREAAETFARMQILAEASEQSEAAATARFNQANQLAQLTAESIRAEDSSLILELLEQVIDDESARVQTRAVALRLLAGLSEEPQATRLLEACVDRAKSIGDRRRQAVCLADLAARVVDRDPALARQRMDIATALAEDDPRSLWQIQARRQDVIWATRTPPEAFEDSLAAMAGERALLARQMMGEERAQLFDGLSWDYRRLAGRAFQHVGDYPELMARIFELIESHRAVVLREQRLATRHGPLDAEVMARAQDINRVQRQLLLATTSAGREQAQSELQRLELAWQRASLDEPESLAAPPPINLAELQAILTDGEALLSYLTMVPAGSESHAVGWLQAISSETVMVFPIPVESALAVTGSLLQGLPDWHTSQARDLLKRLSAQLLEPALNALPDAIDHLIIVPDKALHKLSLEALPGLSGQPLGLTHTLESVPSATIWAAARRQSKRQPSQPGHALVLAAPELLATDFRALDPALPSALANQLPGAAGEARRIRRLLGSSRVELRVGAAASEYSLLEQPLPQHTRLIHFATHAMVHPVRPAASAILLTPGPDHHDGLLQPREIESMSLDGLAIVLAACNGASGPALNAEGVMSLARSFLAAGATAVIASRQEVDDLHAQAFFDQLYRELARGHTLAEAMRRARATLDAAGYPINAWSDYVLYGSGQWQPIDPPPRWPGPALFLAGLVATLLALTSWLPLRSRRP